MNAATGALLVSMARSVVALVAFACIACLCGCQQTPRYRMPVTVRSDKAPPAVWVARDCKGAGCGLYDGKGVRRYDCERQLIRCRVF